MKTMVIAAKRLGRMSGSVILKMRRSPVEPRFSAASSISGLTCVSAADTLK